MILATVTIEVVVEDAAALWLAAARQCVEDGSHGSVEEYQAEYPQDRVSDHLRFILDRTPSDAGFTINESVCEVLHDEDEG